MSLINDIRKTYASFTQAEDIFHKNTMRIADRQRRGTKRSRTGCRTCRARHVKCDETPGACKKCTSTGRSCEGYDAQRLPLPARSGGRKVRTYTEPGNLLLVEPSVGIQWTMTSDEQRCFSHFQHKLLPALGGWFDSTLWNKLVLQLGVMERAVCHAVVALSAIDQDVEVCGTVLPGQELRNAWHFFAMDQAGRALSVLNSRSSSQDPLRREGVLLCCLLFVLLELMQGRYDEAFQHLQGGLRILDGLKAQRQLVTQSPHDCPVDEGLVAAFAQLDIQSAYYGVGGPILHLERELETPPGTTSPPPHVFSFLQCVQPLSPSFMTFHEARRAIEPLASRAFNFISIAMSHSEQDVMLNYGRLGQQQQQVLSELARFARRFSPLREQQYTQLDLKDQKAADIIEILWHALSVSIKTCLVRDPAVLDRFIPAYETILVLAENILSKYPERPSFTLDMGILPPLFMAAYSCSDYSLRWRAIELIRSWHHREGLYDSRWAVYVAEDHMRYQLVMQGIGGDKMPTQYCPEDPKMQIAKELEKNKAGKHGVPGLVS